MNESQRPNVWLPLLFSLTLIAGMLLGYRIRDHVPGRPFFSLDKTTPLREMMDLIKLRYVDSVAIHELADTAISAMLTRLDPHSVLIPASELEINAEAITGQFSGIGLQFAIFSDTIHLLQVLPGSPGEKAGLQTGDRLLRANDSNLTGIRITEERIKRIIRGPIGSEVKLLVMRNNKQISIRVKRGMIPVNSVDAAYEIQPGIGYIRLNKFTQSTYREFMKALEPLTQKGISSLILDLRNNGGGVLDQAVEIADEFLDGDKLITYTEGLHFPKKEYRCKRPGLFEKGKLVLLTDEGSASASEIILGALQDWNRATIIGRRSFGKGLVQEQFELSDGSALRLTVARYYTPVGRSIQRSYHNGGQAYFEDILKRYQTSQSDTAPPQDAPMFTTPSGRRVAGGGGIYPDIHVQHDSSIYNPILLRLYEGGSITRIAYEYLMLHKKSLIEYQQPEKFMNDFNFADGNKPFIRNRLLIDSLNMDTMPPLIVKLIYEKIKASLARQLWRDEGYYRAVNVDDPIINRAMKFLQ